MCCTLFHKGTCLDQGRHKYSLFMLILTGFDESAVRGLKIKCGSHYDIKHMNTGIVLH